MKNYLYLTTAVIGVSMVTVNTTSWAQCVSTQDCATLGYTETSCPNGGVKCPFGNKWICINSGITPEQCTELGFTQTCTGTGYAEGYGPTCNGKYSYCICSSGYKWQLNKCQTPLTGAYGELYFCKGTVVGVRTLEMDFFIAMNDLGKTTWHDADSKSDSYSFCGSSQEGFLPHKDQLKDIYNNKKLINSLLSRYGGTQLTEDDYWSSDHESGLYYYYVDMSNGSVFNAYYANEQFVRPIRVAR